MTMIAEVPPLVSVAVPTRNRARRLDRLLGTLAAQEAVSFGWEVIVVDNGSEDDTEEVVRRHAAGGSIVLRHVFEPRVGLHYGRHRGAREARGLYLAYLDDDMELSTTWIQGVDLLERRRADAVVGRILPLWEGRPPAWLRSLVDDGVYPPLGLLNLGEKRRAVDPLTVFGGNCFLPRRLIFELGGFHPDGFPRERRRYRGDGETGLMRKFRNSGFRSFYDPAATAYHVVSPERMSEAYLCARAYNQGISDSFAYFRDLHGVESGPKPCSRVGRAVETCRRLPLSDLLRTIRTKVTRWGRRVVSRRYVDLLRSFRAAYEDGWRYHQREVDGDPNLLQYVLREQFLDEEGAPESS